MYLSYLDYNNNVVSIEEITYGQAKSLLICAQVNEGIPDDICDDDKIAKQYLSSQGFNLDEVNYMVSSECPDIYVNNDLIDLE